MFVAWMLFIYVYLEIGMSYLSVKNNKLQYFCIFKEGDSEKLEQILVIPLLMTSSIALSLFPKKIRYICLVFLFSSSLFAVFKSYDVFKDGINDILYASTILKNLPPKTVFSDYLAISQLDHYLDYSYKGNFINFYGLHIEDIKNGYVIVGGARGCDIVGSTVLRTHPQFVFSPPENWRLIKEIPGKKTWYREITMKIYEVKE